MPLLGWGKHVGLRIRPLWYRGRLTRESFLVIIDKHHFSYIFKPHYVSDSLPGSKEIMFPATLKAKNLKAATEEAKVERRARGRDRTWLNAKMALRGGPVAAPGTLSRGHFAWNSRTSDC